jgi:hypothetical protein
VRPDIPGAELIILLAISALGMPTALVTTLPGLFLCDMDEDKLVKYSVEFFYILYQSKMADDLVEIRDDLSCPVLVADRLLTTKARKRTKTRKEMGPEVIHRAHRE